MEESGLKTGLIFRQEKLGRLFAVPNAVVNDFSFLRTRQTGKKERLCGSYSRLP